MSTPPLILNNIIKTVINVRMQSVKKAAAPFSPSEGLSRLHRNSFCSTPPSSIYTRQLQHPLLSSWLRQFEGLRPFLLPETKIFVQLSVSANGSLSDLMGRERERARTVPLLNDWFHSCDLISQRKRQVSCTSCIWREAGAGWGFTHRAEQRPHGMRRLPSEPLELPGPRPLSVLLGHLTAPVELRQGAWSISDISRMCG